VTGGRVAFTNCVRIKRLTTRSRVVVASCVVAECPITSGCVVGGSVGKERFKADGRVAGVDCVAKERRITNGRVAGSS